MTAQLFTPVEIGGVTLPNRIVVSPMCQYAAVDGSAQPWHQVHYGMLSMSGAGLLCLEATHVEREGRITQGCLGLYSDDNEAALKPVVEWARGWMPHVKLGIQLAHAGRKASAQRPWKGGGPLTQADAPDLPWTTCSASAIPYDSQMAHAGRARRGRTQARQAGLRRRHPAQRAAGLRRRRAARRARLLPQPVPLAAQQPAHRRVWRQHGKAPPLSARSVRGLPQGMARRQGARHPPLLRRMGRGWPHASRTRSRRRASSRRWAATSSMPARAATRRIRRSRSARATRWRSRRGSAGRPASRPGRSASSPSRSRPNASSPRARPTARCTRRAFLLDPRWGVERRPRAGRGNAALATAGGPRHNYPAVQASAHPGPGGRIGSLHVERVAG